MRSLQQLLSELACLERSGQYLMRCLSDVEQAASHLTQLAPLQEATVEADTQQAVSAIKGHLDIAARFAEDWKTRIERTIS